MLSGRGYVIDKATMSPERLQHVRDDLTVQPEVNSDYSSSVKKWKVYMEDDTHLYLPRYYGLQKFGPPGVVVFSEVRCPRLVSSISLRRDQKHVFDDALRILRSQGGAILACGTGSGKTVIALALACELNVKTLILVSKTFLADQWCERIRQFVPQARVGRVQGQTFDVDDKDIVVGMLQSVCTKTYSDATYGGCACLISDECQHVAAEVFCRALPKVSFKYTLGLSATPTRKDGLTRVINWFLGFDLVTPPVETVSVAEVHVKRVMFSSSTPPYGAVHHNFKGSIFLPKMINDLTVCEDRNVVVVSHILLLLQSDGKHVIVLSDRLCHLDNLKGKLDAAIRDKHLPFCTGLYTGKQKKSELESNKNCDVVLSTYTFGREGLDIPTLNCLVLASPVGDVVQAVGRILRQEHPTQTPTIVDVVDSFSVFGRQSFTRMHFFRKSGFIVHTVSAHA